jgi:hypothetical protein
MSTIGLHSKLISVIVGLSTLTGAQWARAAVSDRDLIQPELSSALLRPAELDPVFGQKLVLRFRGPYERCHPLSVQTSGY